MKQFPSSLAPNGAFLQGMVEELCSGIMHPRCNHRFNAMGRPRHFLRHIPTSYMHNEVKEKVSMVSGLR